VDDSRSSRSRGREPFRPRKPPSKSTDRPIELWLRFLCSACSRPVPAPLKHIGTEQTCPACSSQVQVPQLDRDVGGLEIVTDFLDAERPKDTWNTQCPGCGHPVRVTIDLLGRAVSCQNCHIPLVLGISRRDAASGTGFNPAPSAATSAPGNWNTSCPDCHHDLMVAIDLFGRPFHCGQCQAPLIVQVTHHVEQDSSTRAPVRPTPSFTGGPPPKTAASPTSSPYPRADAGPPPPPFDIPPIQPSPPPPPPFQPSPPGPLFDSDTTSLPHFDAGPVYPHSRPLPRRRSMMAPRTKRVLLFFAIWLGPTAITMLFVMLLSTLPATSPNNAPLRSTNQNSATLIMGCGACMGCFWPIFGVWPSYGLAWRLMPFFVRVIDCPGCGCQLNAVSRWTIGQYTDYRARHIYRVCSPIDGKRVGWMDCPRCKSTILL
jgi:hypothetical protein